MRSHDADELARRDHLGLLPELREMPLISGDKVVGAGGVGAFNKPVVVGVFCHLERAHGLDGVRMALDELE